MQLIHSAAVTGSVIQKKETTQILFENVIGVQIIGNCRNHYITIQYTCAHTATLKFLTSLCLLVQLPLNYSILRHDIYL